MPSTDTGKETQKLDLPDKQQVENRLKWDLI